MALQRYLSQIRSYYGMFRGEPAISGFVWPFTTRRGSSERFAHHHRFDPLSSFRKTSVYPRLDHPASGRSSMAPRSSYAVSLLYMRMHTCCFRYGFLFTKLTSSLSYTPWPVLPNVRYNPVLQTSYSYLTAFSFGSLHYFQAVSHCHHLVSGSFHFPT